MSVRTGDLQSVRLATADAGSLRPCASIPPRRLARRLKALARARKRQHLAYPKKLLARAIANLNP